MTQQGDMTSQQPGADQPGDNAGAAPARPPAALYWPSPYLAEGQSVPDAYPAPARHGQPKYGVPGGPFLTGQFQPGQTQAGQFRTRPQGRPGRLGFGQPAGRAQPQTAADAGQPGFGVTAADQAAPADLVLASAWERLLAMTMDWLLILAASFLLLHEQMTQLLHRFQSVLTAAQTFGTGAEQTALTNFEKDPATVSALVSYFLLAFLMALVYFWALEATSGATLGKRVLGLRVVRADQSPAGIWAAGVRTIVFLLGPAIFTFSPGIGVVGAALISLVGAALWFADSLILATDPQKRSLHDKLAGTLVIRKAPARPSGRR
jgi:uncharacterized RDD family membrane protein YckC